MSKITFHQLKEIYKALSFDESGSKGTIIINSDAQRLSIQNILLNEDNVNESGINSLTPLDTNAIEVGDLIELNVTSPRIGLGILAPNINFLLGTNKAKIKEPRHYYIVSEDYYSGDNDAPECIVTYRSILNLIELLKESALYLDQDKSELLFLYEGKFSIPVLYSYDDFINIDGFYLNKIKNSFSDSLHREQKLAIFSTCIIEMSKGVALENRFKYILSNLYELYEKLSEGYAIFSSDFSYKKIRDEIDAAKVEFTQKIHSALTDIQNQVLGIPIATVISTTQMKASDHFLDYNFIINSSILTGSIIFAIMVWFLVRNQVITLHSLKKDVLSQRIAIDMKFSSLSERFKRDFDELDTRLQSQNKVMSTIKLFILLGVLFTTATYFYLMPDFFEKTLTDNYISIPQIT
ncbi:hypothetical protein ACKC5O_01825 [Aeromonas schubertii]|uniref:Phage-related membrane protein n=1 Tax=Aeromonas schubertii TaxID=652 RepID=A0ABS7VGI4_9GAMM|nr:hypothetical protein [Aeromonas schubertii]MBZ6068510.1 hypothetical protein [Aeromonas schubertii]